MAESMRVRDLRRKNREVISTVPERRYIMAHYTVYRDEIETIESDEEETHEKIIELMTKDMHTVREKSGQNAVSRTQKRSDCSKVN